MSSTSALLILSVTILVFNLTFGEDIVTPSQGCGVNHLMSENDGDIKIIPSDGMVNATAERTIIGKPTTTTSPTVFKPTPIDLNETSSEATIIEELISVSLPNTVALPPPATTESQGTANFCGKLGNCYQWFNDEWALKLSGYKRCEPRDQRRAMRYCCIPPKNIM